MAKNHQTENALFKALVKKYEAQIAHAYATLLIYFDSSVGIGEHPQHIDEMDKQLDIMSTAEEKLATLNKAPDVRPLISSPAKNPVVVVPIPTLPTSSIPVSTSQLLTLA